jgi:hypothetical protein
MVEAYQCSGEMYYMHLYSQTGSQQQAGTPGPSFTDFN